MISSFRMLSGAAIGFAAMLGCVGAMPVEAQTAVERLYADLAKLPAAERQQRLIAGARKEGKVVLIKTTSGKKGVNHARLFEKRFPGVKAERDGLTSQSAAERLIAEETVGRHLSDSLAIGVPDMTRLLDRGIAANYPTPATDRVLPQYRGLLDPQNRWVPWFTTEHGISYNSKILKPADAPKSWEDLCKPQYKGQISLDPIENRFLTGLYFMMGEEKVEQWLKCIGKNAPIIQKGHTTRIMLMLAGDHAIQADNFLYRGALEAKKNPKKAPFKAVYEAPVLLEATGFVINENAPHPHAAALFADWALSDESQQFTFNEGRGVVAMKHPFFPDDVKVVPVNVLDNATQERLQRYWVQYIGDKR